MLIKPGAPIIGPANPSPNNGSAKYGSYDVFLVSILGGIVFRISDEYKNRQSQLRQIAVRYCVDHNI